MRSSLLVRALGALALASSPRADGREPVLLQFATDFPQAPLAANADLTATLYRTASESVLYLRRSDGRGLLWEPLELVVQIAPKAVREHALAVLGGATYVLWNDERFESASSGPTPAETPFLRVHDGASFGPEVQLPVLGPVAERSVFAQDLSVTQAGASAHVHVAARELVYDPLDQVERARLVLYSSHDGGASWLDPLVLSPLGAAPPTGQVRVLAHGLDVHVLWPEGDPQAGPAPLLHQRSSDGGQSLDWLAPQSVPGALAVTRFDADLEASLLALAVENELPAFGSQSSLLVSTPDRGDSWHAPHSFSAPGFLVTQTRNPQVAIAKGSSRLSAVCEAVALPGPFALVATHSSDGGASWEPGQLVAQGWVTAPSLVASAEPRTRTAIGWLDDFILDGGGALGTARARSSLDGGSSYGVALSLADFDVRAFELAWSDLYQNAHAMLLAANSLQSIYAGGFRPQALELFGVQAGSTAVSAAFGGFDGGADLVWLLLSDTLAGASLALGDGRELGLAPSPLLSASLGLAASGPFAVPLSAPGGTAFLPLPLASGLPPGLQLHAVGLSLDLDSIGLLDLSDVIAVGS